MSTAGPIFKTKAGWLTLYALCCGYVQQKEVNGIRTTLWRQHGVNHVRQHNFNTGQRVFWESFSKLGPARQRYAKS